MMDLELNMDEMEMVNGGGIAAGLIGMVFGAAKGALTGGAAGMCVGGPAGAVIGAVGGAFVWGTVAGCGAYVIDERNSK